MENYHSEIMLSIFSKVIYKLQTQNKFYKYLNSFWKNHSTQNALLVMIEKWKTTFNKKIKMGTLFMDLARPFDILDHSLLLAKLSVFGFDNDLLNFPQSYLTNRF